jgi:hypothetical protein
VVPGRRADFFLGPDHQTTVSGLATRLGSRAGWSGEVRMPGGERREVRLSRLAGAGDEVCWLLSAADAAPRGALGPRTPAGRRPIGLAVWDRQLCCAWVDDILEQHDGVPRSHRLGRRMAHLMPGFDSEALEAVMRTVMRTGSPAIDYRHQNRGPAELSRNQSSVISLFRLDAADGVPVGVCSLGVDITGELSARERLVILGEAGKHIGTTRDIMNTAQELAEFSVPLIADYTTVDLSESVRLGGEPLALLSPDAGRIPVFHRAGVASIHPSLPESLWKRGHPVFVPDSSPFTEVLTTGRSHFQPHLDADRDEWFDRDPDRARVVKATNMHTAMIIPIRDSEVTLGIAVFVRTENPVPFDRDDLLLAEELVAQTARKLNLQRTYAHDHGVALALQRNLLPRRLTPGPGLEVAAKYVPADVEDGVGGDWYDVIALGGSRTALVVGDVVGHGIEAAAAMGRLRAAVRTLAYLDLTPDELLEHLQEAAAGFAEDEAFDEPATAAITGATCMYLVYDPRTRRAVGARAGHPPPAIVNPDGTVTFPEVPVGAPLGYGLTPFEHVEFAIPEGSVIALYTDGLVESRGSDIEVGIDRLAKALAQPGLPLNELCRAAFDARPGGGSEAWARLQLRAPTDDATLLLARTGRVAPGDPHAVSASRS